MRVIRTDEVELVEEEGLRFGFPISSATGTAASAVVYFELDPGAELPIHQDSAEELLYIVEGTGEATVGDEKGVVEAGAIAVVPAMAPHGIRNVGEKTLRVVGFFAGSTAVSTFAEPWASGEQVVVIGGPRPIALPLAAEVAA